MNIVITGRDIEMFSYMSTLRSLTMNQICTLFYQKHDPSSMELDLKKARGSLSCRISQLERAGYIEWCHAVSPQRPYDTSNFIKCFFLGPGGARAIKDLRETEEIADAERDARRRKAAQHWNNGQHDIIGNNFLINLIALSSRVEGLSIEEFHGERDCHYFFKYHNNNRRIFQPDLYLAASYDGQVGIPMFVEVDTGKLTSNNIRRKTRRVFEYFESGKYVRDLGSNKFPRVLILVPTWHRLEFYYKAISEARRYYVANLAKWDDCNPLIPKIKDFPFWLTTFDKAGVFEIDEGRLSDAALEPRWVMSPAGKDTFSPFGDWPFPVRKVA